MGVHIGVCMGVHIGVPIGVHIQVLEVLTTTLN